MKDLISISRKSFLAFHFATSVIFLRTVACVMAGKSIHSAGVTEVHYVPMNVILRPIPSVLEEEKVKSLMDTIKVRDLLIYMYISDRELIDATLKIKIV